MNLHLSTGRMIELAAAVLLFAASIYFYRRRDPAGQDYGNQGAVIMLVIAVIMAIHALGGLDYRPSKAEADLLRERSR
jgi:hypothetical protein